MLHISALSPDEYDLYPSVLRELAGPGQDDDSWDRPVDVMEARGWIRGRYRLDAALVDKVRYTRFSDLCSLSAAHVVNLYLTRHTDTKVLSDDS